MSLIQTLKNFIDKQDMSAYIEPPGIGIAWAWKLPDTHPFYNCALAHDHEYDLMRIGESPYKSSDVPDANFFACCIKMASEQPTFVHRWWYKRQAGIFYTLIQQWGKVRWKNAKQ